MAIPGKVERRGGARPGSGPKAATISARQVQSMIRKAKKWAKDRGKDIDDILLSFVYDENLTAQHRLAAIKLWKEYTIARMAEGGETDRSLAPRVYLPELRRAPELEIVPGGKNPYALAAGGKK